jgi:hypothetical protein
VKNILEGKFHGVSFMNYLGCSHICQLGSPSSSAVVFSADSGLEK